MIPISLNTDWNLIVRTILPVIYRDNYTDGQEFGLGDTTQSFFLSPSQPTAGGLIWGIGPVFLWPTGTDNSLGTQKWGVGLTGVSGMAKTPPAMLTSTNRGRLLANRCRIQSAVRVVHSVLGISGRLSLVQFGKLLSGLVILVQMIERPTAQNAKAVILPRNA